MKTFSLDAIIMELSAVSTDTQCRCNRQLPDCDVTWKLLKLYSSDRISVGLRQPWLFHGLRTLRCRFTTGIFEMLCRETVHCLFH